MTYICGQCHEQIVATGDTTTGSSSRRRGIHCHHPSDVGGKNHFLCISCIEETLAKHLGQREIPCPVPHCSSRPFSVSKDLYGVVSSFHFEMHCKQSHLELVAATTKLTDMLVRDPLDSKSKLSN